MADRNFKLTRRELMPIGLVKDWKKEKETDRANEVAKREVLRLQREDKVPAQAFKPREEKYQEPTEILVREPEYTRTFAQFNRGEIKALKPYSWMTTSPYSMSGVETKDR